MSYEPRRWYEVTKEDHKVTLPRLSLPEDNDGLYLVLNAWHHAGYTVWEHYTDNRGMTNSKRLRTG